MRVTGLEMPRNNAAMLLIVGVRFAQIAIAFTLTGGGKTSG